MNPAMGILGLLLLAPPFFPSARTPGGGEAHSPERESLMQRVETARFAGDFPALAALQERLEQRRESAASPVYETSYDLAYLSWREAQLHYVDGDDRARRALLEASREQVERALAARPDDLEARILLSAILSGLSNESLLSRVRFGRRAHALAVENLERAPENPRALIQRGIMYLFAPEAFGGDLDAAIAALRSAHERLSAPASRWPSWGRTDSAAYLGQALALAGRVAEARRVYERELAAEPGARWIREQLLPGLGQAEQ